jgi:2-iminobutanoate/2-iminopropanoate deaminase
MQAVTTIGRRAGAHAARRVRQSLTMGCPDVAATCFCLHDCNGHRIKSQLRAGTLAKRRQTLNPPGAIKTEGTWSLGARAGDFVFVAGMQGVDPATNTLVQDPYARIRQAFLNIRLIAQSEGASLQDCVRLTVYVSDLHRFAPMVDKAQAELWSKPPYPPRTMIEVQRLFDDDIVEIDSVFYAPVKR